MSSGPTATSDPSRHFEEITDNDSPAHLRAYAFYELGRKSGGLATKEGRVYIGLAADLDPDICGEWKGRGQWPCTKSPGHQGEC